MVRINESNNKSYDILFGFDVSKMIDELLSENFIDENLANTIADTISESAQMLNENLDYIKTIEIKFNPPAYGVPKTFQMLGELYSALEGFVFNFKEQYDYAIEGYQRAMKWKVGFDDEDYIDFQEKTRKDIEKIISNYNRQKQKIDSRFNFNFRYD